MEAIKPDRQIHERDCAVRYTRDTDSLVINYESDREFEILKKYLGSRLNGANFWKHDKKEQCVLIPLEYSFSTSQIIDGMKIVELTDRAEAAEAKLAEIKAIWYLDCPELVAEKLQQILETDIVLT